MKTTQTKKLTLMAIFTALSIVVGFVEIPWPFSPIPGLKIDFSEVVILISYLFLGFSRTTIVVVLRSLVREFTLPKGSEYLPYVGEMMAIYSSIVLMLLYKFITWITRSKITCIVDFKSKVSCSLEDNPNLFVEPRVIGETRKPFEFVQPPLWKLIVHSVVVITGFTIMMTLLNFFVTVPIYVSTAEHFFFKSFVLDGKYNFITQGDVFSYLTTVIVIFAPFNLVKGVLVMLVYELTKIGVMRMDMSKI